MKWYFVLNAHAGPSYFESARVTVLSALANTTLEPHCLYDGPEDAFCAWLAARGVTVHHRTVPFLAELERNDGVRGLRPSAARGAYLRVLIPDTEPTDAFVLYTDCDVLFQHDPVPRLAAMRPRYLAAAPEADLADRSFFNSGVMLLNVAAWKAKTPALLRFITDHLPHWNGFSPNDQGALNYFFRGAWEPLDPAFNWKPYWGVQPAAPIVHLHGGRPNEIITRLSEGLPADETSATRKRIYSDAAQIGALLHYGRLYYGYVRQAIGRESALREASVLGNVLTIALLVGEELRHVRHCVLEVFNAADEAIGRVELPLFDATGAGPRRFTATLPDAWTTPAATLRLAGRDFPWIASAIGAAAVPPPAGRTAPVIEGAPAVAAGPRTPPDPRSILKGGTLARVWTLPQTLVRITREGTPRIEPIPVGDTIHWRARYKAVDVEESGPADAALTELQVQVYRERPMVERVLSSLAQMAVLDLVAPKGPVRVGLASKGPVEMTVLRMLGIAASRSRDVAQPEHLAVRAASGHGVQGAGATYAIDGYVRRIRGVADTPGAPVLLGSFQHAAPGFVERLAAGAPVSFTAVESLGEDLRPGLRAILRAPLFVIADEALAPLLALAAPHASVLHLARGTAPDLVRYYCSIRNLFYARFEFDHPPGEVLADETLALLLAAIARMRQANVMTATD